MQDWNWRDECATEAQDPRSRHARLTQAELAERWRLSCRTLEKWRQTRRGPSHLKLGGRVIYRLEDVEAYEAAQLRGAR
ncbi:DNA-binding protein [Dankookia rubra]|uniref:DNA-binding protein n=1 Tax=Dankookia rubra TaxID=1442381 RepID=A0A4R5QGG5_9PROT|nr:DNA-binding protein [Dankookia rubra]